MRRIPLWVIALVALLCTAAWSQTMIEYSGVASDSAAGVSSAAGSVAHSTDTLGRRLGDALANTGQRGSAASPPNPTPADGQRLSARHGATLHIASFPQGAMLFIDHQAIARTPLDVRLSIGKHTLELTLPRYLAWNQEVSATDGAKLSFEPKLQENQQAQPENAQAQTDNRIINLPF
jgi:Arc/MetJ family transcription regulator